MSNEKDNGYFVIQFHRSYVPVNVPVNVPINQRQEWIISVLARKDRITTKEVANKFREITIKTVKRDLLDLKNKGIIEFVGPPKTGHYILKEKRKMHFIDSEIIPK